MSHSLRIDHVQLHTTGSRGQMVGLQGALQQSLNEMVIATAQLPSSAILLIRNYNVAERFPNNIHARRQWTRNLTEQIVEQVRMADRPALRFVNHTGNCVLFRDAAEMLLCYTQDMLVGHQRWYWDMISGSQTFHTTGQIVAVWLNYPQALPAVLTHLPAAMTSRVLQEASPVQIRAMIFAVQQQFMLSDTVLRFDNPIAIADAAKPVAAPWHNVLAAEETESLVPAVVYVWGLARMIAHQPQLARSETFAQDAVTWLHHALSRQLPTRREHFYMDVHHTLSQQLLTSVTPKEVDDGLIRVSTQKAEQGIQTRLGGILYLVNLIEWIFSIIESGVSHVVNRWLLVAALARVLLDKHIQAYQDDAIWQLLDELMQNPADELSGFAPESMPEFRLKAVALAAWGIDSIGYIVQQYDDRLRLFAPELRLILWDGVASERKLKVLEREYAEAAIRLHRLEQPVQAEMITVSVSNLPASLRHWLACILPLCNFRLRGTDTSVIDWNEILVMPANIQKSFTHIDLFTDIHRINMVCRRTGLDKNPGWAVDYGYIINFHFVG